MGNTIGVGGSYSGTTSGAVGDQVLQIKSKVDKQKVINAYKAFNPTGKFDFWLATQKFDDPNIKVVRSVIDGEYYLLDTSLTGKIVGIHQKQYDMSTQQSFLYEKNNLIYSILYVSANNNTQTKTVVLQEQSRFLKIEDFNEIKYKNMVLDIVSEFYTKHNQKE